MWKPGKSAALISCKETPGAASAFKQSLALELSFSGLGTEEGALAMAVLDFAWGSIGPV